MKKILVIVCLSIVYCFQLTAHTPTHDLLMEIREQLPIAFENESVCETLYNKAVATSNKSPVLEGYFGALNVAMSRHAFLFQKMSYFNKGTEILEKAIKNAPNEVELRFLRLTIQMNVPGFLGYSDNIDSDKRYLIYNYQKALPFLRKRIVDFVQDSEGFTASEKEQVK